MLKSKNFLFLWLTALLINIIAFLLIFSQGGLHGPNVTLRYTVKTGVMWYGEGKNLYALPFAGFLINLINFALFKKLARNQNFLLYAVIITGLSVQICLLLSLIFLLTIN